MQRVPRLRVFRERANLPQRELAKMCGISADTIAALEIGYRRAQPRTIDKIAETLTAKAELLCEEMKDGEVQPYTAFYEPDEEGWYLASCVEIPEATTRGHSFEEARKKLRAAVRSIVENRRAEMFRQLQERPDASWETFGVDDE
jgi:transcriptional regulator with XRE-family HTH domain